MANQALVDFLCMAISDNMNLLCIIIGITLICTHFLSVQILVFIKIFLCFCFNRITLNFCILMSIDCPLGNHIKYLPDVFVHHILYSGLHFNVLLCAIPRAFHVLWVIIFLKFLLDPGVVTMSKHFECQYCLYGANISSSRCDNSFLILNKTSWLLSRNNLYTICLQIAVVSRV